MCRWSRLLLKTENYSKVGTSPVQALHTAVCRMFWICSSCSLFSVCFSSCFQVTGRSHHLDLLLSCACTRKKPQSWVNSGYFSGLVTIYCWNSHGISIFFKGGVSFLWHFYSHSRDQGVFLLPLLQWVAVTAAAAPSDILIAHLSSVQFFVETLSSHAMEVVSSVTTSS